MKRRLASLLVAPLVLFAARQAHAAKVGDVIITEIFYNPAPGAAEWFELHNTTDKEIDLDNWSFKDDKTEHKIASSLPLPPGGYVVLGQSDDSATNGGVTVNYAYGSKLGLSSTADELHLLDPSGDEIDAVTFTGDAPWPTSTEGASIALDPASLSSDANDDPASWCLAKTPFPDASGASLGTPGAPNPSCSSGQGGAGGAGGAAQGGAGSGQAGGGAAGGQAGSGAAGGGQGGAGQSGGGQAGAGGAGSCTVIFSKIDINQPDATGATVKDTAEAVELRVQGAFQAGKTTLAGCGVATLSPYESDADAAGVCGPKAGYGDELSIGDLVIPASGFVVVGNVAASDRPWLSKGAAASVLKNGPDFLALRGPDGAVLASISYADNDAPAVYAACPPSPSAVQIPADTNTDDTPPANLVLALCPGGWQLLPEASAPWKAEPSCAGNAGGGAGAGQAGQGAGGQPGKGGASAAGGSGGASAGGASAGGAGGQGQFTEGEAPPSQDGDCSCRGAGRPGGGPGALLALAALAAAARRRR